MIALLLLVRWGAGRRLEGTFRCTVYYTPREVGFTEGRGFDMTPETRPGLGGRMYPRDFLRAVQIEGFGRLARPVGSMPFLFYSGVRWGFAEEPVDTRLQPLVPLQSAAVASKQTKIPVGSHFRIRGPNVTRKLRWQRWHATDTGGGLASGQIDLYWGEDVPLGPGGDMLVPLRATKRPRMVKVVLLD